MRDAVALQDKILIINDMPHKIKGMYYIPGTNKIYIKLKTPENTDINYNLEELLPYFSKQIKL
jgi:hypothetical protein